MRCFILNRVSSSQQRDNLSITVQRDLHPRIADQLGCEYDKSDIFDLEVSSTTYDHGKWKDIKAAIASGRYANGYGIFGSIDRYHRDKDEWFELLTHCLRQKITVVIPDVSSNIPKGQAIPVSEYNPDKFKDLIQLVFEIEEAENFKKKLRKRILSAYAQSRDSGIDVVAGGWKFHGLVWSEKRDCMINGRAYGRWIPNDTKDVVREIFLTPVSIVRMAKILNAKGIKNAGGDTFTSKAVQRIRKRLRYAGKMLNSSGEIIDALNVTPIVSYDEFLEAQHFTRKTKDYKGRHAKYKMVGIVRCGECVSKGLRGNMSRKTWEKARADQARMYCDSTRYLPKEARCRAFSSGISAERMYQIVMDDLKGVLSDKKRLSQAIGDYKEKVERNSKMSEAEGMRKRISQAEKKILNLTKAVSNGYDSAIAIRELRNLQNEKEMYSRQLEDFSLIRKEDVPTVKMLQGIFTGDFLSMFSEAEINEKLKLFIESVHYFVDHIIINYRYFPKSKIITPYLDHRYRDNRSIRYKSAS